MSGDTMYRVPRRHNVAKMRVHDYLYDSAFIVSGARDYARTSFKAAMASAQVVIQPVYKYMFSDYFPRNRTVYHPNCRLPDHVDRSYVGYVHRVVQDRAAPAPQVTGKHLFKFTAQPKKVLPLKTASPDFLPPTPADIAQGPVRPVTRGIQTVYRESSAQTHPWQPDGKAADDCETMPEVMLLDKLHWGPGEPFRTGDLPADFHTTAIINKMRHARTWLSLVEKGKPDCWMKQQKAIIGDIETQDWIFREAEIDELQEIRLRLLHKRQSQTRKEQSSRTAIKLAKLWNHKKQQMNDKITAIHRKRDREIRKLTLLHDSGGRGGLARRLRAARGYGNAIAEAKDPTTDMYAPVARHGYQARRAHKDITYDPSLLITEDHSQLSQLPNWVLENKHRLTKRPGELCERMSKWSEQFLSLLHQHLVQARLGAAQSSVGPLRVLKPRNTSVPPRPTTPEVDCVREDDEASHQAALLLQRCIRGRATQNLMYEGRTRHAELTEELKTTHGLQREDRIRIAKEEAKARDYNTARTAVERKEASEGTIINDHDNDAERDNAITALVDELCGGAVSAALDFLEKELRRLKEERRQHAYILIAMREKQMREAAEAGRRQKEEQRRREHDEMFKRVLGVTQETVDVYLREIVAEGIELCVETEALARVRANADKIERQLQNDSNMSTAEEIETVADLVQHFLLPEAHKSALRQSITDTQRAHVEAARRTIFGLLDEAEIDQELEDKSRKPCDREPVETEHRHDPRWKVIRRQEKVIPTMEERIPPLHEFRCMLNSLIDEVVVESRQNKKDKEHIVVEYKRDFRERVEVELDAREFAEQVFKKAVGLPVPVKPDYHHLMKRIIVGALDMPQEHKASVPKELPSEIRKRQEEEEKIRCKCDKDKVYKLDIMTEAEKANLLPSQLRHLEGKKKCKCDRKSSEDTVSVEESVPETAMTLNLEPVADTLQDHKHRLVSYEGVRSEESSEHQDGHSQEESDE